MTAIPTSWLYAAAHAGGCPGSAWLAALRQFQPSMKMRFQCKVAQFSALSPNSRSRAKAGAHAALRCPISTPATPGNSYCRVGATSGRPNSRGRAKSPMPTGKRNSRVKLDGFQPFTLKAVPRRKPGSTRPCAAPSGPRLSPGHRILRSACCFSRPNPRSRAKSPMPTVKHQSSVKLRSFPRFFPTALLPAMGAA